MAMRVSEVARLYEVSAATVRNWADSQLLPAIRLPGSGERRFRRSDVEALRRKMMSAVGEEQRGE